MKRLQILDGGDRNVTQRLPEALESDGDKRGKLHRLEHIVQYYPSHF